MTDWANAFVQRDTVNVIGRCHFALDNTQGSSFIEAIKGANIGIFGAVNQRRGSFKHLTADWTRELYGCAFLLTTQFIGTLAGASSFTPPFKSDFIGGIFDATHWTNTFDFLTHRDKYTIKSVYAQGVG
jgi:hypothetical protein